MSTLDVSFELCDICRAKQRQQEKAKKRSHISYSSSLWHFPLPSPFLSLPSFSMHRSISLQRKHNSFRGYHSIKARCSFTAMTKTSVSLPPPLLLPLSSNQTCNYSVGQSGPRWHAVKYDHQFGPYPFITVSPLLSWDGWCYSSAPLSPNVGHFPYTGLTHTHGSPHLSQLPCGRASKWGISPSTIYQ